jgi:broad specificity phosphatase PhoE
MSASDIAMCRQTANIVGSASAAADALRRYDAIRAEGHESDIIRHGPWWLVAEPDDDARNPNVATPEDIET